MNGVTQVTYLQFLNVPSLPPPSQALKNMELVLRSDNKKYRCTGTAWVDASGSSSVGSLESTSPINGNPSDLNTPAKLAAAIQALQAKMTALDSDNNNKIGPANIEDLEIPFTTPSTTWEHTHNFGRRPTVIILDENGDEIDGDVQFPDLNTVTIEFITPRTGTLILR